MKTIGGRQIEPKRGPHFALFLLAVIVSLLVFITVLRAQGFAVTVPNAGPVERAGVAVAGIAVPLALGAKSTDGVALIDDAGLPVPVQFRPLARWGASRDDGSAPLRWVQIAFPVSVAAGGSRTYYATYGGRREGALRVLKAPLRIATGVRSFDFGSGFPAGIVAELDGAQAVVMSTAVEHAGSVAACVRQRGTIGPLAFTARWYFETGSAAVRLDWRLENPGAAPPSPAVHFTRMAIRALDARVAIDRALENGAAVVANGAQASAELWPAGGSGPCYGGQYWDGRGSPEDAEALTRYRFEGGRWKTHTIVFDFGGGDPATRIAPFIGYAAPWWTCASGALGQLIAPASPTGTSIEADRFERMVRVLYDDSAADDVPTLGRLGLPAFRARGGTYVGSGPSMFGWANYGDLAWGDGYASNHYALDWGTMINWVRAGDARAFDVGRDLLAHRRDYDQRHSIGDVWRGGQAYEKGFSHGNYRFPEVSHTWVQGLALHYVITGDEGSREALAESLGFFERWKPHKWDGKWGSRQLGWSIEALVHIWNTLGDPAALSLARAAADRWAVLEAGNGYWPNPDSANMVPGSPVHEQTWMHAIVLSALGKLQIADPDPARLPLIDRMARWVEKRMVRADGRVWDRARGSLVEAPDDWRAEVNAHHAFVAVDALCYAAHATGNPHWLDVARPLWVQVTRYPQSDRPLPGFDPIAFRSETYPNAETKVGAVQVLCGLAGQAVLR